MSYIGSWKIDDLLTFYANTQVFATGVATDADSAPAYRIYEDETGTPILTGTMALLDSSNTAGFYSEQITLSAANGFEKGKCYAIYIAATVSGVAGAKHDTFQMEAEVDANRLNWANIDNPTTTQDLSGTSTKALEPTTAGRKLDVSAGGEAGLDWANIGSPTTAQNLSATNIDVDQVVSSVSGAVGSVTGAVGSVTGAVGSVTGNVGGNVVGSVGSVVGAVGSVTGAVGSVTGNVGGNVVGSTASVVGNVGGNVTGSVGSVVGNVGGNLDGNVLGDIVGDVGGDVVGSVGSLATQAKVDVNAEVLDVISVDTFAEPTGVPAATATLSNKIGRTYQSLRNELTVTASEKTFTDDNGAPLWKKPLTDDGTTFTESEGVAP